MDGYQTPEIPSRVVNNIPHISLNNLFSIMTQSLAQNNEQFFENVNVRLSLDLFKKRCGIKKENDTYCYRKMGPKLVNDMKIDPDIECAICSEKIEKWNKVAITPCGHIFHKHCAQKWFTQKCQKPTCPCCRHDVREDMPSL